MSSEPTVAQRIAEHPKWYHTIDVAPSVSTPGTFDLRGIADRLPWPDVKGKRCLDLGTYDGFLAFELEKRGAAEVVATDVPDQASRDWPADRRQEAVQRAETTLGSAKGAGFRLAKELLGSRAERVEINVYDLSPERIGTFDVVVMGSLLLHLRDPLRALEAVRSVCSGSFMSAEQVDTLLTVSHPRRPVCYLKGVGHQPQFFIPNRAGHRRLVEAGGFEVRRMTKVYAEPYGAGAWPAQLESLKTRRARFNSVVARGAGVPHTTLLAEPIMG